MVEAGFDSNRQGAGIAYRDVDEKGMPIVRWQKGINDVKEIQKLCAEVPTPYVVHFRISSCGDGGIAELTHPFPVSAKAELFLEGSTGGFVLFHNGVWTNWREWLMRANLGAPRNMKMPDGKWSDTRAMAYIAAINGINTLELVDEKLIAFSPTTIRVFKETAWTKDTETGIWCSNMGWKSVGGRARYMGFTEASEKTGKGHTTEADWNPTTPCRFARCSNVREHGSVYCTKHKYLENNKAARHLDTPLFCIMHGCQKLRVPAEGFGSPLYCATHARAYGLNPIEPDHKKQQEAEITTKAEQGAQGGDTPEADFRDGAPQAEARPNQQEQVQTGQGGVSEMVPEGGEAAREGSRGTHTHSLTPHEVFEEKQQALRKWACSINVKPFLRRSHIREKGGADTIEEQDRMVRLEEARAGITRVGPL